MAEQNKNTKSKNVKQKNPLIGATAQPSVLSDNARVNIDLDKTMIDSIIDSGLSGGLDIGALEDFTTISNSRDQVYQLIDTMAKDAAASSILRTYTEDVCEPADSGHIIWAESDDPNISKFVNYVLNTMNADKNIFKWAYCLLKYGDVYLRLFRESDFEDALFNKTNIENSSCARQSLNESMSSLDEAINLNIHTTNDPYNYYVEMIPDPGTMFELTKYGQTFGYVEVPNEPNKLSLFDATLGNNPQQLNIANYKMKSNDVNIWQADDFVHACLEDGFERFPEQVSLFLSEQDYNNNTNPQAYTVRRGKSILFDSYKIWREKTLLESSAILNRVTRSSILRKVSVEVGDMSKEQTQRTLHRVKEMMEQKLSLDTGNGMSEYTNPGPIENNVYFATHGGKGDISVESIGGDFDPKSLVDLDWWNTKYYASFGVPKQYYGYCLSGDTDILLLDGTTHKLKDMYEDKDSFINRGILGCNPDGSLCPTKITNIMLTNEHADLLRVWLDNGKFVDVTPDHMMMLRDGSFVRADELSEGDSLMPYYDRIKEGRRQVLDNKSGKFVSQHQIVAAKAGLPTEKGYNIHHKDRNKLNDDFNNLTKLTISEHCAEHNFDLSAMHKKANKARLSDGKPTNANVGSKSITNGSYYTKIKAGEPLPEGFWFAGNPKTEETKAKMSKARRDVLVAHPEYRNLGGFKAGEASESAITNMRRGQAKFWASLSDAEREARCNISRNNGQRNIANAQTERMAKMERERPDSIRRLRKLRCPACGAIFEKKLSNLEYEDYLALNKLIFCCPEHRESMDNGGKLARSYRLFREVGCDSVKYEHNRAAGAERPDTFLKIATLETKLEKLIDFVPEVNHQVIKIEKLSSDNKVYDITVADACHTFALPCGIFVHNCDDAAGFNGGTSLAIISSVYSKGVRRVQNALIQMITDAINLILINKGCKSYLHNFSIKMKTPLSQEELDYRSNFTDKISALSNFMGLFSDVETKSRRLEILKAVVGTLHYDDTLISVIDAELEDAEAAEREAADKAAEEAAAAGAESGGEGADLNLEDLNISESSKSENAMLLNEDIILTEDEDLPSPEELNDRKDFAEIE